MPQVLINIIFSFWIYFILGFGINQNFKVSKTINITFASYIPLSAFFTYFFYSNCSFPFLTAALFSIIIINIINFSLEYFIFSNFQKINRNNLVTLIASLGIYIIIQNVVSLIWGDANESYHMNYSNIRIDILSGVVTLNQLLLISICAITFLVVVIIKYLFPIGNKMEAVSASPNLSEIFGINKSLVFIISSVFTSSIISIVGILIAINYGFHPSMGFNLFIYGFIVIIIGGTNKNMGLLIGAIILSSSQHLGAYIFDSKWYDLISYLVLIIILIYRPLGFSGNQLKKTEI